MGIKLLGKWKEEGGGGGGENGVHGEMDGVEIWGGGV